MRRWLLFAVGIVLIAAGSLLASRIQTADGVRVSDVRFAGSNGARMSALLYVPPNASAATPAPGILAIHGYINSRETQDGFAIEFARRGYVVLALDQTGHGFSTPPAFANGFGGPDGLKYLRSLPFVDKVNIGLEGHSLGGAAVLLAAHQYPDDYKALILVGSTTSPPAAGTATFPRNAAFILGQYDEFTPVMWGNPAFVQPTPGQQNFLARDVGVSTKLKAIFATADTVVTDRTYGDIARGNARRLYLPAVSHPGEHVSTEAIGDATDWFARTLKGGTPRPAGDQIWYWKEFGTLAAFAGFIALLLGAFDVLLALPLFASLRRPHAPLRTVRDRGWWTALLAAILISGLGYFPLMILGGLIPTNALLSQSITTEVAVWALGTALITVLLRRLLKARDAVFTTEWLPSLLIALGVVCIGYLSLVVVSGVFQTDYRFWIVALKPMTLWQFGAFLVYLPAFAAYYLLTFRAMHSDLAVNGESRLAQYATAKTAMAGGIFLIVAADYVPLFASGRLLLPFDPLHPIIAIQFVAILAIVALIAVYTYRRTNSYVPGALISALFVTWYVTVGTATMV
ncbi:MAG TPA: alpha/beta fold hydrolase [Rhizomicrobium sp.]